MKNRGRAFSVIEPMTCVAIILLLAAVVVPYFKDARDRYLRDGSDPQYPQYTLTCRPKGY